MPRFLPLESQLKKSGFNLIAGIDEAGRGPLAGPVVSAAVILKDKARLPGLDDSKKLSKDKRERLFELIIGNSLDFSISIVSHVHIDRVNILRASLFANYLCIEYLRKKPDIALIDGKNRQYLNIPFQQIIRGDSKIRSIAAASILAKVTRDRIMERYHREFSEYGFCRHMGYGTREHRSNLLKYGPCEIHRQSFNWNK